jgi:hypothetical protein
VREEQKQKNVSSRKIKYIDMIMANYPLQWSRVKNPCVYDTQPPCSTCVVDYLQYVKGNILQYKANSSNLTKSQRYSQIAKGMWVNRTKTYSTQSQIYTDNNTNSLSQVNYTNLNISTLPFPTPTTLPITACPQVIPVYANSLPQNIPFSTTNNTLPPLIPTNTAKKSKTNSLVPTNNNQPAVASPIIIPNGGNLICNVVQDKCSGQILNVGVQQTCFSTSFSDVPGSGMLCWTGDKPTYYPRTRVSYSSGGTKFPTNATLIPVNNCL